MSHLKIVRDEPPVHPSTIAEMIRGGQSVSGDLIVKAMRASGLSLAEDGPTLQFLTAKPLCPCSDGRSAQRSGTTSGRPGG